MKANTKNIPVLRFPEFKDEWKKKSLGEVVTFLDHLRKPIKETDRGLIKGIYPYYGASGIIDYVNDYIFDDELILLGEDGANIVTRSTPLAFIVKGKIWVNNHAHVLKPKVNYAVGFISESLERITYDKYNTGTAQPKLNKEVCSKIILQFPTQPEQQKIADFLTAVDERIQQLTKKKQLLEQYKNGVMQQLFSQQLRFKDENGKNYPDWEEHPLQELAKKVTLKNKDNNINTVLTNSATKGIVSQSDYFDNDIANANNLSGYYVVELNDFVYNPRISTSAPVGPIKRNKLTKGLMSPLYTVFRMTNINLDFVEQYFNTTLWHDYMKSIANYGARHDRMSIGINDFMNLPIPYPCIDEQMKIATFIKSLDQKINSANLELDKTQVFKKGLLQQMFV